MPAFVSNSVQSISDFDEFDVVSAPVSLDSLSCVVLSDFEAELIDNSLQANNDEDEVKERKKKFWENPSLHFAKLADLYKTKHSNAVTATIEMMAPTRKGNRGRRRIVLESIGRKVTWGAVQHWMAGRARLPEDVAQRWIEWHRQEAEKHLQVANSMKAVRLAQQSLEAPIEGWRDRRKGTDKSAA